MRDLDKSQFELSIVACEDLRVYVTGSARDGLAISDREVHEIRARFVCFSFAAFKPFIRKRRTDASRMRARAERQKHHGALYDLVPKLFRIARRASTAHIVLGGRAIDRHGPEAGPGALRAFLCDLCPSQGACFTWRHIVTIEPRRDRALKTRLKPRSCYLVTPLSKCVRGPRRVTFDKPPQVHTGHAKTLIIRA